MDFSPYVPRVHYELIPIKMLVSNQDYQRALSRSHIEKAIENFDVRQINPVKVSQREGINYVTNGQHTIEIVAGASGSRDTPVWCMIFDDLSYQDEAKLFADQQKYVKHLQPIEIFNANLEAGSDIQLMIHDLVESYGLQIGNRKGYGVLCAVGTVEKIYNRFGYHVLDRILRLCVATWEGDYNSLASNILNALARIIVVYGEELSDEEFIDRLGAISLKQLARMAKDHRPGSMGYAEAMVQEYNGRKRNPATKLQINKLYTKRFDVAASLQKLQESNNENGQLTIEEVPNYTYTSTSFDEDSGP